MFALCRGNANHLIAKGTEALIVCFVCMCVCSCVCLCLCLCGSFGGGCVRACSPARQTKRTRAAHDSENGAEQEHKRVQRHRKELGAVRIAHCDVVDCLISTHMSASDVCCNSDASERPPRKTKHSRHGNQKHTL